MGEETITSLTIEPEFAGHSLHLTTKFLLRSVPSAPFEHRLGCLIFDLNRISCYPIQNRGWFLPFDSVCG